MTDPLDFASYQETRTFTALDGMRAFAVLWVVAFHCEPSNWDLQSIGLQWIRLQWIGGHGDFGVDVFFVLSGFLITTLLLREPPAPIQKQLGRFYMRRTLRIFPLYYAAVLLYWGASQFARDPESAAAYVDFLPSLCLYWSDYYLAFRPEAHPQFVHAWSLAVEEKFYLLWPLVVLFWPRATLRTAVAGVIAIVVWRAVVAGEGVSEARLYYAFELRLDALLWGAALAALMHRERTYRWVRKLARPTVFWTAFAGLMVTAAVSTNGDQWRYLAVPVCSAVLLAGVVVQPAMAGTSILHNRALRYVGKVSYGIYVLHLLVLSLVLRLMNRFGLEDGLVQFVIGAPLSVLVAGIAFRWFEMPFLRWKQRFRSRAG